MDRETVLIRIAQLGGMERFVSLTTGGLGEMLGISQQSASLNLQRLEKEGLLERTRRGRAHGVRLTRTGMDLLAARFSELSALLGKSREIEVRGTISAGLGEGAYYLSQESYKEQLDENFGFIPFEGTLNVVLSLLDAPLLDLLRRGPGIEVKGFVRDGRTFGSCLCYPCTVNGVKAAIMVPNRTVHKNTLEIVSERRLRDELSLKDGDEVKLVVRYPMDLK
jgi:riboflavin kinase